MRIWGFLILVLLLFSNVLYAREQYIVLHHTASDKPLIKVWKSWWQIFPKYNYGITKDGKIILGRPINIRGAHTIGDRGKFRYKDMNRISIGIVLEGNFTNKLPSQIQLSSLYLLVSKLTKHYNIPFNRDHVIPHKEASKTLCPGEAYDEFWKFLERRKVAKQ